MKISNTNLLLAIAVCQIITTVCAMFVATRTWQVQIDENGYIHADVLGKVRVSSDDELGVKVWGRVEVRNGHRDTLQVKVVP